MANVSTRQAPGDGHMTRLRLITALAFLALAPAVPAHASQRFTDPNATNATLQVNAKGEALVTYTRTNGSVRHVLVWGAINALAPNPEVPQVRFRMDYAGGWGKYRNAGYWQTFMNACRPYDGPALFGFVAGCDAPDGTYWALQSFQRILPVLGFAPFAPGQGTYELHISHWSGALPQLAVAVHWTYGNSAVGLFGQLTYQGQPVYGFSATPPGNPKDRYSRTVYIDTLNSVYGAGWHRETGILLHHPNGTFCHSFVPQIPPPGYPNRSTVPAAPGDAYRVTVMGPGVTPIVQWQGDGVFPWTGTADQQAQETAADALWAQFMTGDAQCAPEAGS
jgi:hypothetical protein